MKLNNDGSLTLWFAPQKPAKAAEVNWLPTPAGQNYNLTIRFYSPTEPYFDRSWVLPDIKKASW